MRSRVGSWGGSSAIRLPKAATEELGIRDGQDVDVSIADGALVIRPLRKRYSLRQLVEEAAGLTPPDVVDDAPEGDEWPSS